MIQRALSALRIGNFKAFADTQRIPLKPITLIFGPNSAGKSSIIQSLAFAHEAEFGRDKRGAARLDVHHTDIGGSSIDLGGFRQFVHRADAANRVEWGADLEVAALDKRLRELLPGVRQVSVTLILGIELDNEGQPIPGADPRVDAVGVTADGEELLHMSHRRQDDQGTVLRIDRLAVKHGAIRQVVRAVIESSTTALAVREDDLTEADAAVAELLPQLLVRAGRFFPEGVEVPAKDTSAGTTQERLFPVSKGNRHEDIAEAVRFYLPRVLNDLVTGLSQALSADLNQLQYLGPIRSLPPRHIAFAEQGDVDWYAGGAYAWDLVRRDARIRQAVNKWLGSDKLKTPYKIVVQALARLEGIQESLKDALESRPAALNLDDMKSLLLGPADSVLLLARKKHIIDNTQVQRLHQLAARFKPRLEGLTDGRNQLLVYTEALGAWQQLSPEPASGDDDGAEARTADLETQRLIGYIEAAEYNLVHDLAIVDQRTNTVVSHRDVGIGISQVLPVLVMSYGSTGKLIAIEQPEIHLHPALQAELGDVFIESALGERGNTFILETHSEHLILRILRRIREKKLEPDSVGVLFVSPTKTGSYVQQLGIDKDGDFIDEWPGGFFEESFVEKFAGR